MAEKNNHFRMLEQYQIKHCTNNNEPRAQHAIAYGLNGKNEETNITQFCLQHDKGGSVSLLTLNSGEKAIMHSLERQN